MFKTDETVRFGQILSARTLRYGKFNEYIIIIIGKKGFVRGLSFYFNLSSRVVIVFVIVFTVPTPRPRPRGPQQLGYSMGSWDTWKLYYNV